MNNNYKFSSISLERLNECHIDLQLLCKKVIKDIDFSVLVGYRGKKEQQLAYDAGKSKLQYPLSYHNRKPSLAIDIAPYPIDFENHKRFYYLGGVVMTIGKRLLEDKMISHAIRWGGDWDRDKDLDDQTFYDLAHFELINLN